MGLVANCKKIWSVRRALDALAVLMLTASPALAEEPQPWQMGFQPSASAVRDRVDQLHDHILMPIITVITLFVLGLLLYVMVRFNAKRHPVPSKISHNTVLELAWTTIPIIILLVIAIPSFKLLYFEDKTAHADMTLKVTGHQWFWSYEYPDQQIASFDSHILTNDNGDPIGSPRLLQVDSPVVLPVHANVRILVEGSDVIHSWFMPSFGVQEYAVVGRTNESWVNIDREGVYYGQCNQICGVNHPFMPIEVLGVSPAKFTAWTACTKAAKDDDKARAACYKPLEADKADAEKVAAGDGGAVTVAASAAQ